MAPTIQAQHVVAVTIPTIAVIFLTYLWYKKRSNSVTRGRSDPGGGSTTKKRNRHRNTVQSLASVSTGINSELESTFPEAMKNAMQKAMRDLETAAPIQEICSDAEESDVAKPTQVLSTDALTDGIIDENFSGKGEENNNLSSRADESNTMSEEDNATDDAIEEPIQQLIKSDVHADLASVADVKLEAKDDVISWADHTESTDENETCELKPRKKESSTSASQCCPMNQQRVAKNEKTNSRNHKEKTPPSTNENLDVAMQKLESMRLADKPKRKTNAKRQSVNRDSLSEDAMDVCSVSRAQSKSPSITSPSQMSSPPSKTKKKKSKKRAKAVNGNHSDDSTTCKTQTDEVSDVGATNACDSIKNYDVCVDRTDKNVKCAFSRVRVPENERVYINSHDDDSLRCSIKKPDDCDRKDVEDHQEDCDNERDSANHSPVDNILDSQSVQFSDAHSEGSSDSGKGCSEGAMSPSPQTPAGGSSISGDQNMVLVYQFVIPQEHVGKLIGRHGQFINTIKGTSNTRIYIKKHPVSFKQKICALEGTQQEINKALELIRSRFPEDAYPDVTLEEFPISLPIACPLRPELIQLDLVEGVNNDVVISSVVSAGHLFLQQPMHPSYQSLQLLNLSMNSVYSSPEAPLVTKPAKDNIVAAPAMDGWYRAQIVSVDESTETCEVRFLDYGGYLTLSTSCLRAVRADFLTLPFQAVECLLANVQPINGTWCEDAKLVVQGLTYGQILQAQVYDYTPEGIPLILLYAVHGTQVILINQELVARGFAFPTLPNDGVQSDELYAYP